MNYNLLKSDSVCFVRILDDDITITIDVTESSDQQMYTDVDTYRINKILSQKHNYFVFFGSGSGNKYYININNLKEAIESDGDKLIFYFIRKPIGANALVVSGRLSELKRMKKLKNILSAI